MHSRCVKKAIRNIVIGTCVLVSTNVFLAGTRAATDLADNAIAYTIAFSKSDLTFGKESGYDTVMIAGTEQALGIPGSPDLPARTILFALPFGKTVDHLEIVSDGKEAMAGEFVIYPSQKLHAQDQEHIFTKPDPGIYGTDAFYPETPTSLGRTGTMSGVDLVSVTVTPLSYNPVQKKLLLHHTVSFRIILKDAYTEKSAYDKACLDAARLCANRTVRTRAEINGMMQAMVVNPETIAARSDKVTELCTTLGIKASGESYDYLIIATEAYADAYGTYSGFIDMKRSEGYAVLVKTVEEIEATYPGAPNLRKQIRNCIYDTYLNNGIRYVLLGHYDSIRLPTQVYTMSWEDGGGEVVSEETPTDMYYTCFDSEWPADPETGVPTYGDDFIPDVSLGRMPAWSGVNVRVFTAKLAAYKNTQDSHKRAIFFGGSDQDERNCGAEYDTALITGKVLGSLAVESRGVFADGDERKILDIVNAIETDGYSIINHIDHASSSMLRFASEAFYRDQTDNPNAYWIDALRNKTYPILYSTGCSPAKFDQDCIGRHWLTNPDGGGCAFIGNSASGIGRHDMLYNFYNSYLASDTHIGPVLDAARTHYATLLLPEDQRPIIIKGLIQTTLLGDPAMKIMLAPENVVVGQVLLNGCGISGVPVCIDGIGSNVTDAAGYYRIAVPSAGTYAIYATHPTLGSPIPSQTISVSGITRHNIILSMAYLTTHVTDQTGMDLSGAKITIMYHDRAMIGYTGYDGTYTCLLEEGDYTVTPSLPAFSFNPSCADIHIEAGSSAFRTFSSVERAYKVEGFVNAGYEGWTHFEGLTILLRDDGIDQPVFVDTSPTASWFSFYLTGGEHTIAPVSPNHWFWPQERVLAVNEGMDGVSFYALDAHQPSMPLEFSVSPLSATTLDIVWADASDNEKGFFVQASTIGSFDASDTTVVTVPIENKTAYDCFVLARWCSFTGTGLIPGQTYYVRVAAYHPEGISDFTEPIPITMPLPPAAPRGVTASYTSSSTVDIRWIDVSQDEKGFMIEASTSFGFDPTEDHYRVGFFENAEEGFPDQATGERSFLGEGMTPGLTYYLRICSYNQWGMSPFIITQPIMMPSLPQAPSELTVWDHTIRETGFTLSWHDRSDNEECFYIEGHGDFGPMGEWVVLPVPGGPDQTRFTCSNLTPGTTYRIRVAAVTTICGKLEGSWSEEIVVETPALRLPAHTNTVVTSDGTELITDVYLPAGVTDPDECPPLPTVLIRTPYGAQTRLDLFGIDGPLHTVTDGIVFVVQDIRGTGANAASRSGDGYIFNADGWDERLHDGADTAAWITTRPWYNGKLGTYGWSALGITQTLLAPATDDVTCQYIIWAPESFYDDFVYRGNVFQKNLCETWLHSIGQDTDSGGCTNLLAEWKSHPSYDDFWQRYDAGKAMTSAVPTIFVTGWYDIFQKGTIKNFVDRRKLSDDQKLIISWTDHAFQPWAAQPDFIDYAMPEGSQWFDNSILAGVFFSRCFSGDGADYYDSLPDVIYYMMGDDTDPAGSDMGWKGADSWPPPETIDSFYYLTSGLEGLDRDLPIMDDESFFASFSYDPAEPSLTCGGANLYLPSGPRNQHNRFYHNCLGFRSEHLISRLKIAGNIRMRLTLSTNVPDTDFTATLVDIFPDGREILVADGIQRLKYRDGSQTETPYTPGDLTEVTIDLGDAAWSFNQGHQIGIYISGGSYPQYELNPNTGADLPTVEIINGKERLVPGTYAVAENSIQINSYRSVLILPVFSDADNPTATLTIRQGEGLCPVSVAPSGAKDDSPSMLDQKFSYIKGQEVSVSLAAPDPYFSGWVIDGHDTCFMGPSMEISVDGENTIEARTDTSPPSSSVTINGGEIITESLDVLLTIQMTDEETEVRTIEISNDNATWTPFFIDIYFGENPTTHQWTLAPGEGEKTVYVRAIDRVGNISAVSSDMIFFLPPVPTAPSGLTAVIAASDKILLAWRDNSPFEDSFLLERSTDPTFPNSPTVVSIALPKDTTRYTDTGLKRNITYYYRVSASRGGRRSMPSNVANLMIAIPAAPSNLAVTRISFYIDPSGVKHPAVSLRWTDNASTEDGFQVMRRLKGQSGFIAVRRVTQDQTVYTDTDPALECTKVYEYAVRATLKDMRSGNSNIVAADTRL